MFEKLVLRDFQRHRKLVVVLDPRVTTLVGPSDVGFTFILKRIILIP